MISWTCSSLGILLSDLVILLDLYTGDPVLPAVTPYMLGAGSRLVYILEVDSFTIVGCLEGKCFVKEPKNTIYVTI